MGSVYNHTRVSLPSSHTHVVVSETQGFGYSHTRIQSYTVTHSWIFMSVVHIKFLKKNSNLQWNYKDYGHDLV